MHRLLTWRYWLLGARMIGYLFELLEGAAARCRVGLACDWRGSSPTWLWCWPDFVRHKMLKWTFLLRIFRSRIAKLFWVCERSWHRLELVTTVFVWLRWVNRFLRNSFVVPSCQCADFKTINLVLLMLCQILTSFDAVEIGMLPRVLNSMLWLLHRCF